MNPLQKPDTFYLTLANPNPTSSKTKDGPVYRVSFELSQAEWQNFMDAETKGMVIECACQVAHKNEPEPQRDPKTVDAFSGKTDAETKGGPLSVRSDRLARDMTFHRFLETIEKTWCDRREKDGELWVDVARDYIRERCHVKSRAELDHDKAAADKFRKLISSYVHWATENGYDIA